MVDHHSLLAGAFPPAACLPANGGKAIVVLGDPRVVALSLWKSEQQKGSFRGFLADYLSALVKSPFGERFFSCALAWSKEAIFGPRRTQTFRADKLWSLDRQEVAAELTRIARFLELPEPDQRADALAAEALLQVQQQQSQKGPFEPTAMDMRLFEDALDAMAEETRSLWLQLVLSWAQGGDRCMKDVARPALAPRLAQMPSLSSPWAHQAGFCKPCCFAMRGACRYLAEACQYCHADHTRPSRPSKAARRKMREQPGGARRGEARGWQITPDTMPPA